MTCFAPALDLAAMRVLAAMAADTVGGQLLVGRHGGVTDVAVDLGVHAEQGKFGFRGMIISYRLPVLIVVAIVALGAEAPGVRVVGFVAAVAVLGNLILVISAPMAGKTADFVVYAQKLIARFLEVVVLRRLPLLGHVALCAIIAARPTVFIVGCVTTYASLRSRLIAAADMTGIASHHRVRPGQLEVRLVMIELAAGPSQGAVTLAARLRELLVVDVVILVAADAGHRRLAPRLILLVAALALERGMRSLEREVGEAMVELRAAQLHDVGVAAPMFRMARLAFADTGVGHAAVVALVLPYVLGDVFVTIEAQRGLSADVRAVMAIAAAFFLFDVRLGHLAGHQQRLRVGGPDWFRGGSDKGCKERHGQ